MFNNFLSFNQSFNEMILRETIQCGKYFKAQYLLLWHCQNQNLQIIENVEKIALVLDLDDSR